MDYSNKTIQQLLLVAQKVFNAFIRQRDSKGDYFVCISCNRHQALHQMNAGHFYSAGNHSYLRFNENNVHGQCIRCNMHLHGNLIPYQAGLIRKIGLDKVQELDQWKHFSMKWDRVQLIGIIQLYKQYLKEAA